MPLTPVEVRHVELRRGLFGYNRAAVQRLMEDIADSFEAVWRERADLAERCEALEAEISRHTELESLLRSTLVSAERASQEMKEQARRESDVIVSEANGEARKIIRDAITEKEQLLGEVRRIRSMLRSALEVVDEAPAAEPTAAQRADAARSPLPGTGLAPEPRQAPTAPPAAQQPGQQQVGPSASQSGQPAGSTVQAGDEQTEDGLRKLAG
jgi:cell division initiation protein